MSRTVLDGDFHITGNLTCAGTLPEYARSGLVEEAAAYFEIPLTSWRVWDAFGTVLPGTSANDDLGLYAGTWATGAPYIGTSDLKAAGATTRYARTSFVLPIEYQQARAAYLAVDGGMLTTIADTSCVVDFEAYKCDLDATVGGSDLVTTTAATINSLTFAEKTFTLTNTNLAPGVKLDIRMAITCTDGASGTAVIAAIARTGLKLNIKG